MKEKIKKITTNKYFPIFVLFVTMILVHLILKINTKDDVWFKKILDNQSLQKYIVDRYKTWSSRLIIETVLIGLLHLPSAVWIILDSLMFAIIAYSISKVFKLNNCWTLVLLIFIYPFLDMSGAGWYATTVNYIWSLALGLFSLIPIINFIDGKKEKKFMYPLYVISLIFGCNQEQMCAIIFGIYFLYLIYQIKNKKISKFAIIQLILSLASLIFILTCPGNKVRNSREIITWYPSYKSFGPLTKTFLGVVSTFNSSVFNINILVLILSIILVYFTFKKNNKNQNLCIKSISIIPIVIICILNIFEKEFASLFPYIDTIIGVVKQYSDSPSNVTMGVASIFIFGISGIFYLSILITIYNMFDKKENKIIASLVFLIGLASRFIMGFSATLFASSVRTFLFYDFAIIIVIAMKLNEEEKNNFNKFNIIFGILAILQISNTIISQRNLHI